MPVSSTSYSYFVEEPLEGTSFGDRILRKISEFINKIRLKLSDIKNPDCAFHQREYVFGYQKHKFAPSQNWGRNEDIPRYAKKLVVSEKVSQLFKENGFRIESPKMNPFGSGICFGEVLSLIREILHLNDPTQERIFERVSEHERGGPLEATEIQALSHAIQSTDLFLKYQYHGCYFDNIIENEYIDFITQYLAQNTSIDRQSCLSRFCEKNPNCLTVAHLLVNFIEFHNASGPSDFLSSIRQEKFNSLSTVDQRVIRTLSLSLTKSAEGKFKLDTDAFAINYKEKQLIPFCKLMKMDAKKVGAFSPKGLLDKLDDLEEGVYYLGFPDHSTFLIKEKDGGYFFDPNLGLGYAEYKNEKFKNMLRRRFELDFGKIERYKPTQEVDQQKWNRLPSEMHHLKIRKEFYPQLIKKKETNSLFKDLMVFKFAKA